MERTLWIVVIATIVWAVSMAIEASRFDKSRDKGLIGRFDSPVAMLELARSQDDFAAVIDQGERQKNVKVMQINTYMDFIFIILYCATLILLGAVSRLESVARTILMISVLATGLCDYWENFRLLRLLRIVKRNILTQTLLPRPVSLLKWGLFAFDLIVVGVAVLRVTPRTDLLVTMSMCLFLGAACTTIGLFRKSVIGWSVLCLFPALLIAAWVWRP